MMIPLPKLLNSSGAEVRRIRPVSLSIVENIIPLSTASLTIKKEDAFPDRSYLELYNANGSAGVYRARTPDTSYRGNTITIGLEHAVCEIGDFLVRNNGEQEQKTLSAAMSHFMSYYSGSKWQLGSVSVSGNVVVQDAYQDILSAINGAVAQVPGAMLAYNFSTSPWTLSVVSRGTTVSAEGRLSRNIEKCNVKRDDSSLFTRVWVEGLGGEGVMGHMDADTLSTYGVIETQLGGNNYTQAQAQTVASAYLARHKRPVYSITIDGLDFSGITGEALDRVALGKLYRLAIPEDNVTIEEHITSIRWTDVYGKSYAINLTLAEQDNSSIRFIQNQKKQEQSNYQSLYNGYTSGDSKLNGKIDDTQEDVDWVWRKTGIDSLGEEETLMTRIQINAEGIQTEVTRANTAEGKLSSRITQNADSITAEVTRATAKEGTLSSRITQTAESITAEVTRATEAEGTLSSRITQTAESIQSEVTRATEAEGTLSSRITQNADAITLEVQRATTAEGEKYDIVSGISITSDGITISGSKYLTLTSGGTFTVNSGNFSVNDQGELRASKLITVAEDGTETVVNMKNWPFWKLNYATVKSIDTSGGTLTIVTTAGSYSFDGAATVTLTGSWSGSTFTVDASNGASRSETFSAGTGTGNQTSGGKHTISTFNSSHKAYGYVNASSLSGSRLYTFNVDATSEYTAGYDSAKIGHSWSGATVTFSKGTSGANSVGLTLSAGASIEYNSSTHKYTATGSAIAERATRATGTAVSGTEAYDAGYTAGYNKGYSDGTEYGWGVGHTAGWQAYYDSGWWSKPNANSNVCKIPNRSATGSETWFTVTATHSGISWSNPAQYYIRATDTAYATIDNVNVASVYIYDAHKFNSDGGIN